MSSKISFFKPFVVKKILRRFFSPSRTSWLDRTEPFSRAFGFDRGDAIDRRFMDDFLYLNRACISGSILEIGDDRYTFKFGSNISRAVVLAGLGKKVRYQSHEGDLTNLETFSDLGRFDCVIATNVLNFIYDFDSAVRGLSLLVKEEGSCLATVAGCVPVSRYDYDRWGDFWRFNDMSIRRVFDRYFDAVEVYPFGNAPLAAAFIMGLAQEEVPPHLFEINDSDYQILIAVNARSPKKL